MRRFKNHLIGVDQGTKVLFSDFEDGGEMWTGEGSRERRVAVQFSEKYKTAPSVQISMNMWDVDQKSNYRADMSVDNISESGFEIVFKTWGDTKIARVRASWLVIGEVKDDDEWDMY